jgi:hypothetical protein
MNKPWYGKTSDLPVEERYCTCCKRELSAAYQMLELDQRSQTYHGFCDVPEDQSQGWFPFGLICARKQNKAEAVRRANVESHNA